MWIPSTPMIPDGFWHFPGAMRVISGPQECSEDIQSGSTCEKHDFSMPKSTDFPHVVQDLAEVESGRKINGSRPSEGAPRATGDQIQQKPSRNFISGPASPLRVILGSLKVVSWFSFWRPYRVGFYRRALKQTWKNQAHWFTRHFALSLRLRSKGMGDWKSLSRISTFLQAWHTLIFSVYPCAKST